MQALQREDSFHLGVKGLIRNSQGSVLLLQVNKAQLRAADAAYWDLPGGRVQQGDTVFDTLRREILEETGIVTITDIAEVSMVLSNIRIPLEGGSSVGLILSIYSCAMADPRQPIALSDEHIAFEWVSPQVAAERLAVKYPPDFCQQVARLS